MAPYCQLRDPDLVNGPPSPSPPYMPYLSKREKSVVTFTKSCDASVVIPVASLFFALRSISESINGRRRYLYLARRQTPAKKLARAARARGGRLSQLVVELGFELVGDGLVAVGDADAVEAVMTLSRTCMSPLLVLCARRCVLVALS